MSLITSQRARWSGATLMVLLSVLSAGSLSTKVRAYLPSSRLLRRHAPATPLSIRLTGKTHLFSTLSESGIDELNAKIKTKGDEIRDLKAAGIDKPELAPHIEELLALKAQLPVTEEPPKVKKQKKKTSAKKKKPPAVNKAIEEMSENELRLNRLAKVESMKGAGVEPFEYTYQTTHTALQLAELYEGKLEPGEEDEESHVEVAGRVMTRRVFGKLAFFTLQDETGIIQLQFDKSRLGESFKVRRVLFFLSFSFLLSACDTQLLFLSTSLKRRICLKIIATQRLDRRWRYCGCTRHSSTH